MTTGRNLPGALLAGLLVVSALAAGLAGVAGTAAAGHDSPGNYTVVLPDGSDSQPGDRNGANASIWHLGSLNGSFAGTATPQGFAEVDYLVVESREIDFSQCTTEDTAAFGVDRGNDDRGTKTDDSLLNHRKDSKFRANGILVEFFDEGDIAGEPTHMNRTDQIVAVQRDCYRMPDEPGWYRIYSALNGTGYDGTFFEVEMRSHYFYICDCDGEAEAREQLGPPPSEQGDDDAGDGGGGGSDDADGGTDTSTATATATPTPTASSAGGDQDGGADPTATPRRATASPTPEPPENDRGADERDGTEDENRQTGDRGSGGDRRRTQEGTDEPSRETEVARRTATDVPTTPTIADGPGFGPGLALVALLGAALLAARR